MIKNVLIRDIHLYIIEVEVISLIKYGDKLIKGFTVSGSFLPPLPLPK